MNNIIDLIQQSQAVVLVSHLNPDGDAVGSLLALKAALLKLGKQATAVLLNGTPSAFRFLDVQDKEIQMSLPLKEGALYLILDASDLGRTGYYASFQALKANNHFAYIDHHPKGDLDKFVDACYYNENISSTSELVYQLIIDLGIKIDAHMAECILTGIYTDTGGFQHSNTSAQTLAVVSDLMQRGGKLEKIVQKITLSKSLINLKLLGLSLERLRLKKHGLAISYLQYEDIQELGGSNEYLNGIIGQLNSLDNISACLFITEAVRGQIRGMLRSGSNSSLKVNRLAELMSGGGHPKASGFVIPGHLKKDPAGWHILPKPE
jgi:phosphoesterase RecJ-like protein